MIPTLSTTLSLLSICFLLGSCANPCQRLCNEMLAYASDCGLDVQSNDISECRAAQQGITDEEADQCQVGLNPTRDPESGKDVPFFRLAWSCQDLANNTLGGGDDDSAQ